MINLFHNKNILFLLSIVGLSACSTGSMPDSDTNANLAITSSLQNNKHSLVKFSKSGKYRITINSIIWPIPLQKIHSWMLQIETLNGVVVTLAAIYVFGGMPKHGHGFPTKPRVSKHLGEGKYRVDGIKFNMPGAWEMRFNIKINGSRDRVVFDINLK